MTTKNPPRLGFLAQGIALLAAASAFAAPALARAEGPDLLEEPFFLALSLFDQESDFTVELNGEAQTGDRIDLDSNFGGHDDSRFRLDGYWRFAERHKVRFMWFNSSVDATRTIDEEINWGDATFPVGATVTMDRAFDIYELAYEYAFLRRENFELAGTFGLHWVSLDIELSATLEGQPGETVDVSDTADANAPLPVIGLHGTWNIAGDFWLDVGAQLFQLEYDVYDGSLLDIKAAAFWQPKPWLGIGLGYTHDKVDVDMDGSKFDGSLEWTYDGPQLFLSVAF